MYGSKTAYLFVDNLTYHLLVLLLPFCPINTLSIPLLLVNCNNLLILMAVHICMMFSSCYLANGVVSAMVLVCATISGNKFFQVFINLNSITVKQCSLLYVSISGVHNSSL